MARRSVMQHQFSQVPSAKIPRSSFDRSHGLKTTFDAGYLVPIYVDEALPGDTFSMNMTGFARLATPIKPIMDNLFMQTFFFAVPVRLIWQNWAKFNGEQENPGDSTDYIVPEVIMPATPGATPGTLWDYFGLPILVPSLRVCAFWPRAYNLIYREWFRDQNLQDSPVVNTDDGPDEAADYTLLRRGKRHDYFTSALPWPQKGDPVTVPLGDKVPVTGLGVRSGWQPLQVDENVIESDGTQKTYTSGGNTDNAIAQALFWEKNPDGNYPNIYADLTLAQGFTINDLRQSFQIQKLLERDARGGTRYTEIIRSHFQVISPDARLQRPEFLGGGTTMVNINPIAQTQGTDTQGEPTTDTPQGNLAAMGTASLNGHGFTKSFTEHCVIIGLVNVRADLTYQQTLNRMWSRQTRFDFYWPALSHLGEQEVLSKEIYCDGTPDDDSVWGYQERYAEYRYKPSQITGLFRSEAAQSLDVWHLSQDFQTRPVLNESFIEDNPPIDRIIAVQDEPHFLFDAYFKLRCARPMPLYGVPGLIDHF